jgi:hypothetical protein
LNGLQASYYENKDKPNRALHTDICSPWATIPTWSGLTKNERVELFKEGHNIWLNLVHELRPDVMFISVAKEHLGEEFKYIDDWTIFTVDKKGQTRENPYIVKKYLFKANDLRIPVIFGRAAQNPFGFLGKGQKLELGKLIYSMFRNYK